MQKLEQTTLAVFLELKTLFETPISKRNERRIGELVTIANHLTGVLANQKSQSQTDVEAHFWDLAHGNV